MHDEQGATFNVEVGMARQWRGLEGDVVVGFGLERSAEEVVEWSRECHVGGEFSGEARGGQLFVGVGDGGAEGLVLDVVGVFLVDVKASGGGLELVLVGEGETAAESRVGDDGVEVFGEIGDFCAKAFEGFGSEATVARAEEALSGLDVEVVAGEGALPPIGGDEGGEMAFVGRLVG